ncbi:growth-regulating factor 1-like [Andrographis paniculata]|uniref:growth-regulating factor 1-like n=1 Tax=Andrographis paniculata TaxID=175694 RepID=UPI0021E79707|nr:growth-regulating factor 1-like [Andrographis paniculata]
MDFNVVGFDNLPCPNPATFGSHRTENQDFRDFKLARTSSPSATVFGYGCTSRGPFSPSQWMELEHQALIYKYISSNVPIPNYLLNPIRKAAAAYSAFPPAFTANSFGLHLGYCSNDPEPGRCRRTDGKKWRCSKEAVADQKYCERHMNRGRHRSRKPVEGQSGHSSTTKPPATTPPSTAAAAPPPPNHHQFNTLQTGYDLQHYHHKIGSKHHSQSELGLVYDESLLGSQGNRSELRQFIDNWPKFQGEHRSGVAAWPEKATHLSISIPTTDYVPSAAASSPMNRKFAASSSQELEMGLEVGIADKLKPMPSWVPISWESPMGGPLGEALHAKSNDPGSCKNSKPLNLMDSLPASPKGILAESSNKRFDAAGRCIGFICPGTAINPSLPAL